MLKVFTYFQHLLINNGIKIVNSRLNDLFQDYNFLYVTEVFNDTKNQQTYQNFMESKIIIINSYCESISSAKATHLVLGFKKTIIFINKNSLSFLEKLFLTNPNLTICFLSDSEDIFSTNIKYNKQNFDQTFKDEISKFNEKFIIQGKKDPSIIKLFVSMKSCITGFLIKQSYFKLNKNRMIYFDSIEEKKIEKYEKIDENEFVELRLLGIGSLFEASLNYFIRKEELVVIKKPNSSDEEIFKLKKREEENYLKIQHFLLPKCYGLTNNGFLIIEFINGKTLGNEKELTYDEKLNVIFQLMLIIEFLHRKHFIFRDLKPNNIIIDEKKMAVLIDFDRMVFRDVYSNDYIYSTDFSSIYVAPEVNLGNYDYGSDIFSLGKIICYLISTEKEEFHNELKEMYEKCIKENIKERPSITELIIEFYINYHSRIIFIKLFENHENYFRNIFDQYVIDAMKSLENDPDSPVTMNYLGIIYEKGKSVQINANKAIYYYELASKKNYAKSQCNLGILYYYGDIIESDIDKAIHYLELSAEQNYPDAEYLLGVINYEGNNKVQKNIAKALSYFISAANHGSSKAQYQLGVIYLQGYVVTKNIEKSIYYFELAANQDVIQAQNNLGAIFFDGKHVPRDINKAIKYLIMAAEKGHADSQFNLGLLYSNGEVIKHDINKAIYYYTKASEQNHVESQFNLAVIYDEGIYVQRDINKAIYYYQRAADQFYSDAFYNLGVIYYENKNIKRDIDKSIYYFTKAANQYDPQAQFKLGVIFYDGLYVVTDINKAIYYLKQASDQYYMKAHYNLGLIYYIGKNIKRDINKAIYYFLRGAEQDDYKSQYQLGVIYSDKKSKYFNIDKAIYYFNLAANKNDSEALLRLALFYCNSEFLPIDINKTIDYLYKSARLNNEKAQFIIGFIYLKGLNVSKNIEKGVNFLQQSANNYCDQAMFIVGFLYHDGKCVNQDIVKSIEYYKQASSFNNQYAKNNLGIIYKNGFGDKIHKNSQNAIVYFEEAMRQKKDLISMYNLAHLYIFDVVDVNNENIDKSINLLFELLEQKFIPSLELLSIAFLLKFKFNFKKIEEEIEKFNDKKYYSFVVELIEKEKLCVKSIFDKLYDFYRNNVYYYNELIDYFPLRTLGAKTDQINDAKNINNDFFEGFGII